MRHHFRGCVLTKPLPQSRIRELVDADPESLIRIYSYQCVDGWEAAQSRGYLTGSHGHNLDDFWDHSYEWMREAMRKRIPDFSGDLPVWAWPKRSSNKKLFKDPYVRITALVPRKRILASCYDMWHIHLNNGFIATSDAESEDYESRWPERVEPGSDPIHTVWTQKNWDIVFDIRESRSGYMLENYGFLSRIQLCVDRIYLNEVVDVRIPKTSK